MRYKNSLTVTLCSHTELPVCFLHDIVWLHSQNTPIKERLTPILWKTCLDNNYNRAFISLYFMTPMSFKHSFNE